MQSEKTNGAALRDRREDEGLSITDAARKFSVPWWKYRRWEHEHAPELHDALMLERVWGIAADAWPRRERKTKKATRRTGRAA